MPLTACDVSLWTNARSCSGSDRRRRSGTAARAATSRHWPARDRRGRAASRPSSSAPRSFGPRQREAVGPGSRPDRSGRPPGPAARGGRRRRRCVPRQDRRSPGSRQPALSGQRAPGRPRRRRRPAPRAAARSAAIACAELLHLGRRPRRAASPPARTRLGEASTNGEAAEAAGPPGSDRIGRRRGLTVGRRAISLNVGSGSDPCGLPSPWVLIGSLRDFLDRRGRESDPCDLLHRRSSRRPCGLP